MKTSWFTNEWGVILGASSGFGLATAHELASRGMNLYGVHFDRRSAMDRVNLEIEKMKHHNVEVEYFNFNAADKEERLSAIESMREKLRAEKPLRVVLHSLAFGSLKRYFDSEHDNELSRSQMEMTLNVMGHSLVYWVQDLRKVGLIGQGTRIFALTSAGGRRVWPNYGAVSAAKAALESHIRQIAFELGKEGVRANAICAGVTDTPALRKIPGHEQLVECATCSNPSERMTTPEDVAKAICALSLPEADWITGNVINVDGGEEISG